MRKCKLKVCARRCVISGFIMRFIFVFCFIDRDRDEQERFTTILLFFQVLHFLEQHVFLTWVCLHHLTQVREENLLVNWYRKILTTSTSYWPGVLHPKMVQRIIMTLNLQWCRQTLSHTGTVCVWVMDCGYWCDRVNLYIWLWVCTYVQECVCVVHLLNCFAFCTMAGTVL